MAEKLQFPFAIKNVTEEEDQLAKRYYKDYIRPFSRVGPSGYFGVAGYGDHAADIYNVEVRPDDVWVTSFSRAGTTWLQELVWLVANDLDYEAAAATPLFKRYSFIEYPVQEAEIKKAEPENKNMGGKRATEHDFRDVHALPSPRYIKSHLPLSLLPPNLLDTAKVFYIARDVRDVAVSFFFAHKLFRYFDEDVSFEEYWELFKKDLVLHMPIFPHMEEAWQKRTHPHMTFVFYEEMQKDLRGVIDRVVKSFNKEYTDEQKNRLIEHLSFDNMSKVFNKDGKSDKVNEIKFIRKGLSGNWVKYFNTDKLRDEADDYVERHLKKTDLRFPDVDN